jgi:hypothetical protein
MQLKGSLRATGCMADLLGGACAEGTQSVHSHSWHTSRFAAQHHKCLLHHPRNLLYVLRATQGGSFGGCACLQSYTRREEDREIKPCCCIFQKSSHRLCQLHGSADTCDKKSEGFSCCQGESRYCSWKNSVLTVVVISTSNGSMAAVHLEEGRCGPVLQVGEAPVACFGG